MVFRVVLGFRHIVAKGLAMFNDGFENPVAAENGDILQPWP